MNLYPINLSANGTIRELTRYIRPCELDEFRKPVRIDRIEDKDLCDTFFREDELYDEDRDDASTYHPYSIDDIPAYNPNDITVRDINNIMYNSQCQIETEYPDYATIYETGRKVYLETIPSDTHDGKIIFRLIDDGYSPDAVINIASKAHRNKYGINWTMAYGGLKLIRKGYPINLVLEYMDKAKLKAPNGTFWYEEGLLEFIEANPEHRDDVVTKLDDGREIFDRVGAKYYNQIYDNCNNADDVIRIINSCRINTYTQFSSAFDPDYAYLTSRPLAQLSVKILKNEGNKWSKSANTLIKELGKILVKCEKKGRNKATNLYMQISKFIDDGGSAKEASKFIKQYYDEKLAQAYPFE